MFTQSLQLLSHDENYNEALVDGGGDGAPEWNKKEKQIMLWTVDNMQFWLGHCILAYYRDSSASDFGADKRKKA